MPINKELQRKEIPFLVPDLPSVQDILPMLEQIDKNRWYSNFGPLLNDFEHGLYDTFFPELNPSEERLVACASGTAAIELALLALDLPKNAKILLPSFTFAATATAVIRAGYRPIFTDVDSGSWLLTPQLAKDVLNYLTVDAVIPVAAFGVPQDAAAWDKFVRDTGIPVLIDAAAALGNQRVSQNITVCFSLHATKAFGVGEGGLIVAPSADCARSMRKLSNFGFDEFNIDSVGGNYKLSEYHAAVGLAQLRRVKTIFTRRENVRQAYHKHLDLFLQWGRFQTVSHDMWPSIPEVTGIQRHGFHAAAAIKLHDNVDLTIDSLIQSLGRQGIGARRMYSPALHTQPAFSTCDTINPRGGRELSVTEPLVDKLIGLPFHNFLTESDVAFIAATFVAEVDKIKSSHNISTNL